MKFSVVAQFTGVMPEHDDNYYPCDTTLNDCLHAARAAGLDVDEPSEPGDSEYSYLAEEGSGNDWFEKLQDCQASGIIERDKFTEFVESIGAYAEDCETLGTLGGPLGSIVGDIPMRCESQVLIESIRVTPVPCNSNGEFLAGDERTWDRVRSAFISVYGN